MIEDAYEEINFEDESAIVNSFSAWICMQSCGYYEKINENEGEEYL
ncbi:hypothetical protein [Bacillus sp. S/N-304-OC-R1]|nr:hypothetical protein [Bacillus sp. S/N-304-OC-R1]MBY0121487.1 hypothetical protein [Bacillus sp. S/N-304-OC-R1]